MPIYDQKCLNCGEVREMYTPRFVNPPCRTCGAATERIWTGKGPCVVDDSIPGGMVIENLDKHPRTFYSRSDFKHELTARGLTSPLVEGIGSSRFQHRGDPDGSDKARRLTDPNTGRTTSRSSRWI